MSRSCSRVTSPVPAFSTLITSAPNHASSCVQVGPDCTWVKSRIRTPSSALLIVWSPTLIGFVPSGAAPPPVLGDRLGRSIQKVAVFLDMGGETQGVLADQPRG